MDKGTVIRTAILAIALINQLLVSLDLYALPWSLEQQEQIVSTIVLAAASIWTWFKNNYVTVKGQKQKEVLKQHGLAE